MFQRLMVDLAKNVAGSKVFLEGAVKEAKVITGTL